jgi:hypothetical protein
MMGNQMKSVTKLGLVILPLAFLTACANTAEMEALKASVESAQSTADSALMAAKNAQSTADQAQLSASSAEVIALEARDAAAAAQSTADDNSSKLDRMFEKAMSK